MNIIDFYRSLLQDVSMVDTDGDGFLSALYKGEVVPLTVEGKRLVLPTNEILKGGNWDQRIAFHPMGEKINRGESAILKALKDYIYLKVNVTLSTLLQTLMEVGASPEKTGPIGPEGAEFLKAVGGVDEKTVTALNSVLKACSKDPNRRLISIYLKHGSTGTEGYARQAIVSFPIMDEFELDESTIFGVKMSKKAKESIHKLLEYILGDEKTRALYSYGTNNLEAPYFHALINAFYKLAVRFNHLFEVHKKHLGDVEALHFNLGWAEYIDQLALFRGMIPTQPGNEGEVVGDASAKVDALNQQAAEIFDRKPVSRPDVPWDEDRRTGPDDRRQEERRSGLDDRRTGLDDRRREPEPKRPNAIGMDEFRNQFRHKEPERPRGGFYREDERRGGGFARDFERDDRSGRDRYDSRYDTRRSLLDERSPRGGGRRGGYL